MFKANVLAASVNTAGERLTTFELTYPRCIHSEIMTHRVFSRNSASSRAIPAEKLIVAVEENPFIPLYWGQNQKGMQAGESLSQDAIEECTDWWIIARDNCVLAAKTMQAAGLHKQIVNRILEPWMWITVILSTTSFEHFRRLRCHPAAEPHFQLLAGMMAEAYDNTLPVLLKEGEWHMPLIGFEGDEKHSIEEQKKLSAARCARVSYLTHDGRRDVSADLALHDRLANGKHWSPFEHVATPAPGKRIGNFQGWKQYRKEFQDEFVPDQCQ